MIEFCSCGAQLPPDAIFCHKCGKPQREVSPEAPPEEVAERALPPFVPIRPEAIPPATQPLGFRNPVAVRIALLVGVVATVLGFIPLLNWLGAGFFAVYFYRRKTGSLLNVGAGARMGWITGVLMFPMWAAILIGEVFSGRLDSVMQQQMKGWPGQDPASVQQMVAILTSAPGVAMMLALCFLVITCLSVAGGALGAKMVGRG